MCERFFLYLDDVDLCWRVRLAGWQVAFCPEALVWHDYEFDKGKEKWYWLERNRHWTVLANYSPLSLLVLAPMLAGAELMVLGLALRERWVRQLMRAWISTLQGAPELLRWRRIVQAQPAASDREIVARMTGRFQTSRSESPLRSRVKPVAGSLSARPSGGPGLRGSLNARRPRGSPTVILPVRLQPDVDRLRNIYLHSAFRASDMSDAPILPCRRPGLQRVVDDRGGHRSAARACSAVRCAGRGRRIDRRHGRPSRRWPARAC